MSFISVSEKLKSKASLFKMKCSRYLSMLIPCIISSKKYIAEKSNLPSAGGGTGTQTTLGGNLVNAGNNVVMEIAAVYCGSLVWVLLGIDIIVMACTKNEKILAASRIALGVLLVAYIVLKILSAGNGGVIGTTADEITGWIQ